MVSAASGQMNLQANLTKAGKGWDKGCFGLMAKPANPTSLETHHETQRCTANHGVRRQAHEAHRNNPCRKLAHTWHVSFFLWCVDVYVHDYIPSSVSTSGKFTLLNLKWSWEDSQTEPTICGDFSSFVRCELVGYTKMPYIYLQYIYVCMYTNT